MGKSPDALIECTAALPVEACKNSFGDFVKFVCSVQEHPDDCVCQNKPKVVRNAFAMMIQSAARGKPDGLCLPKRIETPRNQLDKLKNQLIDMFEDMALGWDTPNPSHMHAVTDLTNILWSIDGHHATLEARTHRLPAMFRELKGYNVPQASKHRKRAAENLKVSTLRKHVNTLKSMLSTTWIDRQRWKVKKAIQELLSILHGYATYLDEKNESMAAYRSGEHSRSMTDSESIQHLRKTQRMDPSLSEVNEAVGRAEIFTPISMSDYSPVDRKKRYSYLQLLKQGLACAECVLYRHAAGGNAGDRYFIWKIPEHCSVDELSNENLSIIRKLEKDSGDCSGPEHLNEADIDERVKVAISAEDEDIVMDLRHTNTNASDRFQVFFDAVETYLADRTAVQE
ncbi:PREDICTED: uncharacterized protein LOC106817728 [Priapulus caudatus]|uniref:Uncharacterized protein LOC106817728 n=1 Tax=Priapulus caudatus TaxID=37621 RepID=A0ABM1F0D0_PRICU|nr:PREDICTED: uncharacterized protein LOC106817728 [Priapulus caudatus]